MMTIEEMREYQEALNETEVFYDGTHIETDGVPYDIDRLDWRKDSSFASVLELREIVFMIQEYTPNVFKDCESITVLYSGVRYEYCIKDGLWTET